MDDALGLLYAALAALSYAAMTILVRRGGQRGGGGDGVLVALCANVVMHSLVVGGRSLAGTSPPWTLRGVGWFVLAGLLTTLLGRVALYSGIRRLGPSRAAALKNLSPFVSVGAALWLLGERLTTLSGVGVVLALTCYLVFMLDGYRTAGAPFPEPAAVPAPADSTGTVSLRAPVVVGAAPDVRRASLVGYAACTAAAVFYGIGTVVRRVGLDAMPDPYAGALLSALAGSVVYLGYLRSRGGLSSAISATRRDPNLDYVLAGVASTCGQLSLFLALSMTAVSYVSVVASSDTLLTMLVAAALFGHSEALKLRIVIPAVGIFIATTLIALG